MIDMISKLVGEFASAVTKESSRMIRSEVEYVTGTIRKNIREGFREGFDAIRAGIFYLFLGMGCTLVGLVFAIWGLAKFFDSYFEQFNVAGLGFIVFGLLVLLIGVFSFAMSKPK
jgi:hypothetical protein